MHEHRRTEGALIYRIAALNGCTVLYEIGAYALVLTPEGECFRARVGDGGEVDLTIVPPSVDLESIAARRGPIKSRREVWVWRGARVSLSPDDVGRILRADDGVIE